MDAVIPEPGSERGAVIVVHGVGNQERGATLSALVRTLGEVMPGGTGTEVIARPDVLVKPADEPPDPLDCPTDRCRTGAYYMHADLAARDAAGAHYWPFYEFYWADESRIGDSILDEPWSFWQMIAGLPRIGLYTFDGAPGRQARLLDRLVRGLYVLAWAALVPRFVMAMVVAILYVARYRAASAAMHGPLAWTDRIRTGADLLLVAVLLVWRFTTPRRDRETCRKIVTTAVIALTAATLLADMLPMGIRYSPFELVPLERIVAFLSGNAAPAVPPRVSEADVSPAVRLYALNTPTGLTGALGYALILAWVVTTIVRSVLRRLMGTAARSAADDFDRQVYRTTTWWYVIGIVVLVVHPLVFQYGWSRVRQLKGPPWVLISGSNEPPEDWAEEVERRLYPWYEGFTHGVIAPFAIVSFVLLTSSTVRKASCPVWSW